MHNIMQQIYSFENLARACEALDCKGYALTETERDKYIELCKLAGVDPAPVATMPIEKD